MLVPKSSLAAVYDSIRKSSLEVEGCSVVIMVATDADALCACRIITMLMQLDMISYNIKPVSSYVDLQARFADVQATMGETVRSVILLNCGGCVDVYDQLPGVEKIQDLAVYIIDANRPFHLDNVRSDTPNIYVVDDAHQERDVQDLVDLGQALEDGDEAEEVEDEADEEEDDDDDADLAERRRKLNDGRYATLSPRSKRAFRREVRQHLQSYYRGTWQCTAASALCLELVDQLNRVSNEFIWLSAVGVTDQLVHERIDLERYSDQFAWHQDKVQSRNALDAGEALTEEVQDEESGTSVRVPITGGRGHVRLVCEEEYRFMLYRHWSLYNAMLHSSFVAARLGIWTERGERTLRQLFASMGVPLSEVQQKYSYMDDRLKRELRDKLTEFAPKFGLTDFTYPSFLKVSAYSTQIAAADVAHAVSALLESGGTSGPLPSAATSAGRAHRVDEGGEADKENGQGVVNGSDQDDDTAVAAAGGPEEAAPKGEAWEDMFWVAYAALGARSTEDPELLRGLQLATQLQRAVVNTGKMVIEKRQMQATGPFTRVVLSDCPALHFFLNSPQALSRLALFLSDAQRESGKRHRPVVVAVPNVQARKHLVVAVTGSARFGDVRKNNFGWRFRKATDKMDAHVWHVRFNTATIEVTSSDLSVFLSALIHVG